MSAQPAPYEYPPTGVTTVGARSPSTAPPLPPLIPKAAAHHWERQHRSQPRAHPSGVSRPAPPPLPLHTRPAFRTHGGQQPTEGPFKRDGSMAVDRRATSGARPSSSRAGTSQGRTVASRRHGLAAPRLTHHSGHCDHPRAVCHTHPSPHGW